MPSQVEHSPRVVNPDSLDFGSRLIPRIALLVAAGLILFLFEAAIPRPLPWLKPGLSNIATILALYLYGARAALTVTCLRICVGGLILGSFFSPTFLFGLGGGIGATLLMIWAKSRDLFSIIGVSITGAFTHNLIQVLLAALLVVGHQRALVLLPIMLLSSLFSGFLVGIFAHFLLNRFRKTGIKTS